MQKYLVWCFAASIQEQTGLISFIFAFNHMADKFTLNHLQLRDSISALR